jgi:non-ribosomal peptide synthetase component F
MIESLEGQRAWHYWCSRLEGLKAIDLPADHTREEIGRSPGATFQFALPAALVMQIRELAQVENTTAFVVLAAAFHSLLHRHTGAPTIQFGTPLAGRSQPEFENTVGYFVNPVVLSASVKPDITFRRHLAMMREVIVAALQYGDFPFPEIVKRLRPERHAGRTPLFQVLLNLIRTTPGSAEGQILQSGSGVFRSGSLELEPIPVEQHEAQFDLDLMLLDTGSVVKASLKYRTDLFEADTVARLAQDFSALLSAAMTDPDRRISDFPLSAKARVMAAETEREEFAI